MNQASDTAATRISVEEAAHRLGVCAESVRRGIRNGVIRNTIRFGQVYRVLESEVDRLLREGVNFSLEQPTGATDPNNEAEDAN